MTPTRSVRPRKAVILLAVLVVVTLLTLAAYKYSDYMLSESRATDASIRASQARLYADSGIHYAAAMLAGDQSQTLGGNPWDNVQSFQNVAVGPEDPKGRGRFTVLSLLPPELASDGQPYRFGVADESAKINLNGLLALDRGKGEIATKFLMGLPYMTEEIAAAILDWMDPDETPRTGGAENDSYATQSLPYRCKNGPFDSLEELLLVKGVTPQLLFGNDRNRNGTLDADEADGVGGGNMGWSSYLTVYSREANADSTGKARVNLNGRDIKQVQTQLAQSGISQSLQDFILAYRLYGGTNPSSGGDSKGGGKQPAAPPPADPGAVTQKMQDDLAKSDEKRKLRRIRSLWDLVNSTVQTSVGTGREARTVAFPSPLSDPAAQGELLPILLDKCTTSNRTDLRPRVNALTAPRTVLAAIQLASGVAEGEVEAILSNRPAPGGDAGDLRYRTAAWLVTDAKLPIDTVKKLDAYLTGRTQVYRVQSLGYHEKGGPTARVEAVIDTNLGRPRIVYWRDLSELGRGFEVPRGAP